MHSLKTFINELSSKTYQSALISSLNKPGHYAIYGNDGRRQENKRIKGSTNDLYKRALIRSRQRESGVIPEMFLSNTIACSSGLLFEAKKASQEVPKASSDTKGKLHELLVGFHLKGGQHMLRHKDDNKDSPKQAHDKLKATLHPKEYKKINARAKHAAEHIAKTHLKGQGKILDVHWTSQNGDIKRSTGVDSTQTEDASDIIIHTRRKGKKLKHTGVSLKVSDSSSPHIPLANGGVETTYGQKIHSAHKKRLLRKIKGLHAVKSSPKARRELLKNNPKIKEQVHVENARTLKRIARNLHKTLEAMSSKELVNHIRTHVLAAHPTPLQRAGHAHVRHVTTSNSRGENRSHGYNPSTKFEHILGDPRKITMHHRGTGVTFKHNGKTFATQRIKFNSQSDPLSAIKTSGSTAGSSEKAQKVKEVAKKVTMKRKQKGKTK